MNITYKSLYPSIILEFNISPNTQLGRIDIFNTWKVLEKESGKEYYIKDSGNAYDFEYADIKEGNKIVKIRKKVSLYEDSEFTKPYKENIEYVAGNYETIKYERIYEHENAFKYEKQSRGGEFIENMVTNNVIEFSKRWLGLADFVDILKDIDEYYLKNSFGPYNDSSCIRPTTRELDKPISESHSNGIVRPIRLIDRNKEMENYNYVDPRKWLN